MVANGKPLSEILGFLTRIVEEQSDRDVVAAILLVDESGLLRIGAAPSLPDEYNRAIDGIKPDEDLGTCSVAAATGSVVVTPDIEADPKWESIRHLPLDLGLRAAWSRPIIAADGSVLGTFGTYFRQCREPTALERQLVEILSHTAALAIERRRADEERERLLASERKSRAEADAANRAKDKFLAVLSHELRTPLSPVVMTIPAIEADPALPAKFREDLAMVRRNIELEVKLIDDLLDLSRVTSGKLRLQMQGVHVHKVLLHSVYNTSAEAASKAIAIQQDLDAPQDLITADPARLQQVFWNLLRNAVKFTLRGGDIVVRTWNEPESGRLLVEVRDTGIGISAEALPRIFEAFDQGDAQAPGQFGGLGLGLAIAKVVVEIHGGTIAASSDGRGKGACFTVGLPLSKTAERAVPTVGGDAAPKREATGQTRLLLVEDHRDTARTLARLLNGSGYIVKTAHSVASALQLAENEPFDILVSDIGLPDASGYELMQQIKARYGIKGIALSGYGMEDDVNRSRAAGFVDHVTKPVNVDELEAVIQRVRGYGS
jgi:signal transduction histidine kinase/CheY-like chemotaxis protein